MVARRLPETALRIITRNTRQPVYAAKAGRLGLRLINLKPNGCLDFFLKLYLAQKLKNRLSSLVGLSQHSGTGLRQDLVRGVINSLMCHVGIADSGFRSLQIFSPDIEAADRVFQAVLVGAKISSLFVDSSERYI